MSRGHRDPRLDLPLLELECMKILWARGQATVQQIHSELFPARPLAYTTVMTVMDRLARKGVVEREKRGRAHLYRPAFPQSLIRENAITRLIETFFRGSRDELKRYLEGNSAVAVLLPPPDRKRRSANPQASTHRGPQRSIDPTLL